MTTILNASELVQLVAIAAAVGLTITATIGPSVARCSPVRRCVIADRRQSPVEESRRRN
jgi:hypothetical protein